LQGDPFSEIHPRGASKEESMLSPEEKGTRERQRAKVLFSLTAFGEVVIKSWKPRITAPFLWKLAVTVFSGRERAGVNRRGIAGKTDGSRA